MKIALTVLCIVYAVLSLFALGTMNKQIEALQKITNKQSKVIKWQSEKLNRLDQENLTCHKLIKDVGLSINRRFQSHKAWTYQHVSDLAVQVSELSDLIRGEETIEGITNGINGEETTEADTTE